jgi:uncharacterized protein YndB with AHSA1/START domain
MTTTTLAPVRKRMRVNAPPARAFDVFTTGMRRWWRADYSINRSPIRDIVVEPRAGGRWFERGEDGSECQWGKVLAWEPPGRLVLAWQITPEWQFDPNLLTEIEVRFTADGGSGTLVELEHRLDGYGAAAAQMREIFDAPAPNAWMGLLERFADEVQ